MTCGSWHVHRRRGLLVLLTVRVRMRLRRGVCEPRLVTRLEHVTRNPSQLVAVHRQMRVRKTLRLCRMGQDIRRGPLLCVRLGWVRVQLVYERRAATSATEATRSR